MTEIEITSIHRGSGYTSVFGNVELARFSCIVGGIELVGVRLMRRPEGQLFASNAMKGGGVGRDRTGARIVDDALQEQIAELARARLAEIPADAADPMRSHRGRRRNG